MLNKSRVFLLLVFTVCYILMLTTLSYAEVCGDVDCSGGEPDIADITRLIDYLYLSHDPLCDPMLADVNNSGGEPDISDITRLIDFLYLSHDPLDCPTTSDCPATVTDIDGNSYQTVLIGDQCWMAENLKVTHYRNGDPIPNVTDPSAWEGLTTGAYCNYDNNEGHVATYGRLYNWYAVDDSRYIAPAGWHVPTDDEWKQLEMYLGMSQAEVDATGWRGTDEGGKLKATGTTHWFPPNTGATNESGFSALPGGYRHYGFFVNMDYDANFWSSTENDSTHAWSRSLYYYNSQVGRFYYNKRAGFSVRCVRDH